MPLIRREQRDELTPLREAMNRLFEDSFVWPRLEWGAVQRVPLDIRESEDQQRYIIEASLPGFKPEEIQVTVSGETVTIAAATAPEEEVKKGMYLRQERYTGETSRSITLPGPIDASKIEASYGHGVLTLSVPKAEEIQPRHIPIRVKEAVSV